MSDSVSDSPQPVDAESIAPGFQILRRARAQLHEFSQLQQLSVTWFRHPGRPWFRVTADEPVVPNPAAVRHLSTTASCLESLGLDPAFSVDQLRAMATEFAEASLSAPNQRWASEGAARVYVRVRTLPAILKWCDDDVLTSHADALKSHVDFVWARVVSSDPKKQGVSEAPDQEPPQGEVAEEDQWQGYPPNSFHSYWAVRLLEEYEARRLPALDAQLLEKRRIVELWCSQALSTHAALLAMGSERGDAMQLAWALATQFIHPPASALTSQTTRYEVLRAALRAFFGAQHRDGAWPLYEPIFHYPEAGNAYCYTYETLTELLRPALAVESGRVIRDLLRPYLPNLLLSLQHAQHTAMALPEGALGWCSGHHPHRTNAEGWATAAVYSFAQCLRRLVGQWTADVAASELSVRRPSYGGSAEALATLRERGDSWTARKGVSVGRRLAALFLHPITARAEPTVLLDPDRKIIGKEQARSAILFGPPGTSKTTIVESLAGSIGWRFVSVHASDFLRDGMDRIPSRADWIFTRLMELDRTVILFDEIDELIRERSGASDPVGRFLTTSMLPKLANLWDQRRVLFFVATNDISSADAAIRRSQRFDASIYVAPPSYHVKQAILTTGLGALPPQVTWEAVEQALEAAEPNLEKALGVLALLRYDQIVELIARTRAIAQGAHVTELHLRNALIDMEAALRELEWHSEKHRNSFLLQRHFVASERQDFRAEQMCHLKAGTLEGQKETVASDEDGRIVRLSGFLEDQPSSVDDEGHWIIQSGEERAEDDKLLFFCWRDKAIVVEPLEAPDG